VPGLRRIHHRLSRWARQLDDLLLRARLEFLDVRLALGEGVQAVTELEGLTR
jgi:hypothetical protein